MAPDVRHSAILGLGMAEAGTSLLAALPDLPARERDYAYIALGLARHARAIPAVVDALPRLSAIHALGLFERVPDDVGDRLVRLARSRDARVADQAVTALGRLQLHLDAVHRALSADNVGVQWSALLALAHYARPKDAAVAARILMREGFKSGRGQHKNFSVLALGDLAARLDPNGKTRKKILRFLRERALDSNNNYLRACAAIALGVAGDKASADPIAALLHNTTVNDYVIGAACVGLGLLQATGHAGTVRTTVLETRRWNADARGYALLGIALMGDTTQLATLKKHSRGEVQTERQASLALGLLGGKDEVRALARYFSSDWDTRANVAVSNAAFAFGWNRDGRAVSGLVQLTRNPHPRIRAMAVIALGYIAARDRVSPLTRCYENTSFRNRFGHWDLLHEISRIL